MATVIQVENLSKSYQIGHQSREPYLALRDVMVETVKNAGRRIVHPMKTGSRGDSVEEIWALKDVSFEVKQGDRVGIIGRNGAGKSTLLKILSRITEPTSGRVRIKGRVGSLLEVGTGFHPELTGRENIFLNGAILGMTKAEIKRKFDEIVDFAEIEKFLDTPVKRYSSGMYVRLAFSVAAHLEPEILVVDEVLAVGDALFQKKCIERMERIASAGITIFLVSHNMSTILGLSSKCLLLSDGKLEIIGDVRDVVMTYQNKYIVGVSGQLDLKSAIHYGSGRGKFTYIEMNQCDKDGKSVYFPETGCDLHFKVNIEAHSYIRDANVGLTIYDELGNRIIDANTITKGELLNLGAGQKASVNFVLKNVLLKPGLYTVGLWIGIANQEDIDGVRYATSFKFEGRREDFLYSKPFPGVYTCDYYHTIELYA